ncbi:hypothetical protein, partial [Escherichia coli]
KKIKRCHLSGTLHVKVIKHIIVLRKHKPLFLKEILRKKFPVQKPKFLPWKLSIVKIRKQAVDAISQKCIIFLFFTFIFDKSTYCIIYKKQQ